MSILYSVPVLMKADKIEFAIRNQQIYTTANLYLEDL